MKHNLYLFMLLSLFSSELFSQSEGYLSSTLTNASTGSFSFELENVTVSQLTQSQTLWIYGDGNFEIKQSNVLGAAHQFRVVPTDATHVYGIGIYDDGSLPPEYYSNTVGNSFTPTGNTVTSSGLVTAWHYGALKLFPNALNHLSIPVGIIALKNHQASAVSGNVYLYYKSNLKRNGTTSSAVSYSVLNDYYNYGNVSSQSLQNAPSKSGYQILRAWSYTSLQPSEERHLFVSLNSNTGWQNISDITTASYETEFLLLVTGSGTSSFENEITVQSGIEAYHDPAFLDVSHSTNKEGKEAHTFDLLFYNDGRMPVRNIQAEFRFPGGLTEKDVQVIEKSIGPVGFTVEQLLTDDACILKFEAKNVGLGKYDPLDPNTQGKIKIQVNGPFQNWQAVKASVRFDDMPEEEAQWRNVFSTEN